MEPGKYRLIMALLQHNINLAYKDKNWDAVDYSLDTITDFQEIIREIEIYRKKKKV